ncbi:MAG TPA: class I SAM-dependent methyltransferase [Spirochaetia bacterium]|nr:class I SAM-dependent methyltransferase [Spirochaetia bacterium]
MKKSWTKSSHRILEHATSLNRYNRFIASLFKKYLGENILEIGSGIGGLSQFLPKSNITLSDIRSDYFIYLKSQFHYKILILDIEKTPPINLHNSFDTIISSNVFEHIKRDGDAISNCSKLLKKKGRLLLFVPARPEIYGSLDKAMGHFHRYTKEDLYHKTKSANLKIIKIKYVNFPGFFAWWVRGKLPSKSNSDNFMAKIFDTIIVPFLYLEKYLPIPFGQSLILVAEKS